MRHNSEARNATARATHHPIANHSLVVFAPNDGHKYCPRYDKRPDNHKTMLVERQNECSLSFNVSSFGSPASITLVDIKAQHGNHMLGPFVTSISCAAVLFVILSPQARIIAMLSADRSILSPRRVLSSCCVPLPEVEGPSPQVPTDSDNLQSSQSTMSSFPHTPLPNYH